MVRGFLVAVALAAFLAADAVAQQSDPVVDNYRAYMAALQRHDSLASEAPAAAALAASQARDGDSGRTAVLALNLARLRLALAKYAEAREPATIAARIAQMRGAAAGVDAVMAQIALGRAELGVGDALGGDHLQAAIVAANGRHDLDSDAYEGAIELGRWARTSRHYDVARIAFEAAANHADGAPSDANLARGVAHAAAASAILLGASSGQMRAAVREAYPMLTQAARELWPLAQGDGINGQLTPGQLAFARALAWRSVAYAAGHTAGTDNDEVQNPIGAVGCHYRVLHIYEDNSAYYPLSAESRREGATVIVRATFDDRGHVTGTQVAASAPNESFSAPASSLVGRLQLVRSGNSAPNCVMPRQIFIPVHFMMP